MSLGRTDSPIGDERGSMSKPSSERSGVVSGEVDGRDTGEAEGDGPGEASISISPKPSTSYSHWTAILATLFLKTSRTDLPRRWRGISRG